MSRRDSDSNRSQTSLEFLAGVKYDRTQNLALLAGLATELLNGVASPDWRIFAGLNYTFGPVFGSQPSYSSRHENDYELVTSQVLQFEFDSSALTQPSLEPLEEIISHFKSMGALQEIVVEGHTDSVGRAAYNQQLSMRRAEAIRNILVERLKLDASQVKSEGYGASRPIADNGNFQGRQQNRRVEFRVKRK